MLLVHDSIIVGVRNGSLFSHRRHRLGEQGREGVLDDGHSSGCSMGALYICIAVLTPPVSLVPTFESLQHPFTTLLPLDRWSPVDAEGESKRR